MEKVSLNRAAVMVMAVAGLNVALGYIRELVVAYYYGVSNELEIFLVAVSIPQIIGMEVLGITVTVLLPAYVSIKTTQGNAAAGAQAGKWLSVVVAAVMAGALALYALSPYACHLLAPGFDDDQVAKASGWMRISIPVMVFLGTSGMAKLVLDSDKRFFFPALSKGMGSVSFVVVCVMLSGRASGLNLVWAMLASSFIILAFSCFPLLPKLFSAGRENRARGTGRMLEDSRIPGLILIVALNSAVYHFYSLVDRGFASTLQGGSIAILNYGNMLINVTDTLFSLAIATVIFPELCEKYANKETSSFVSIARRAMTLCAALYALITLLIVALSKPMVSLLLQRGKFTLDATAGVAAVLSILAIGLIPSGQWAIMRVFFRAQNLHVYLLHVAFIVLVGKVVLNYAFLRYGVNGLALSSSATTWLGYAYLQYRFSRNVRQLAAQPT